MAFLMSTTQWVFALAIAVPLSALYGYALYRLATRRW